MDNIALIVIKTALGQRIDGCDTIIPLVTSVHEQSGSKKCSFCACQFVIDDENKNEILAF